MNPDRRRINAPSGPDLSTIDRDVIGPLSACHQITAVNCGAFLRREGDFLPGQGLLRGCDPPGMPGRPGVGTDVPVWAG
jgi:hypothetical protein